MASGTNAISITNHTNEPIELISIQDNSVAEGDRKKICTIHPKDSYVFFTDRVDSISWEKQKK